MGTPFMGTPLTEGTLEGVPLAEGALEGRALVASLLTTPPQVADPIPMTHPVAPAPFAGTLLTGILLADASPNGVIFDGVMVEKDAIKEDNLKEANLEKGSVKKASPLQDPGASGELAVASIEGAGGEAALPSMPESSIAEKSESFLAKGEEKSFFAKIKSFFGFDDEKTQQPESKSAQGAKAQLARAGSAGGRGAESLFAPLEPGMDDGDAGLVTSQPVGANDEFISGELPQIPSGFSQMPADSGQIDSGDELRLPDGFNEIDEDFSTVEASSSSSMPGSGEPDFEALNSAGSGLAGSSLAGAGSTDPASAATSFAGSNNRDAGNISLSKEDSKPEMSLAIPTEFEEYATGATGGALGDAAKNELDTQKETLGQKQNQTQESLQRQSSKLFQPSEQAVMPANPGASSAEQMGKLTTKSAINSAAEQSAQVVTPANSGTSSVEQMGKLTTKSAINSAAEQSEQALTPANSGASSIEQMGKLTTKSAINSAAEQSEQAVTPANSGVSSAEQMGKLTTKSAVNSAAEQSSQVVTPANPGASSAEQVGKLTTKPAGKQVAKSDDKLEAKQPTTPVTPVKPAGKLPNASTGKEPLPTPSYAKELTLPPREETATSKYEAELELRQSAKSELPHISPEELSLAQDAQEAKPDPVQLKFIANEAQLLVLPNDDIVLGELTEDAKLDLIDLRLYVDLFWEEYRKSKNEEKRAEIDNFVDNYDANFNKTASLHGENHAYEGLTEAFKAIRNDNILSLISILNSYPLLQLSDGNGNTLLHAAARVGNYPAAKLLVLKGVDIFAKNRLHQTALSIARELSHDEIVTLLKSAGLK
ncbi:MAG: hypothetical protein COA94_00200 [Rickettsiales bacterium]|nr:MAG: hypothetical protein COA94_00200 [Rickettsiales bacterium]